jgi:hypothetical protein
MKHERLLYNFTQTLKKAVIPRKERLSYYMPRHGLQDKIKTDCVCEGVTEFES